MAARGLARPARVRKDARDGGTAVGTHATGADPVFQNVVSVALDQQRMTRVTPGVLPPTHPSGDVSRVDEVESLLRADLAGADQDVGRRVAHAAELVILVEGGHMPGDVPVDSRDVS